MMAISPLKRYYICRQPDFGNVVLSCTEMELKFALRKSTSTFSITQCLRITHYIEQCQRLWSTNFTQQKKDAQHNSEYFVQLKFKLQRKSEDCPIPKNSTFCKQHLKASQAELQNIAGNYSSFFVFFPLIVFVLILPSSYMQGLNCSGS